MGVAMSFAGAAQEVYQWFQPPQVAAPELAVEAAHASGGPNAGTVFAGEQALRDGAVGDERYAELPAGVEDAVALGVAVQEVVVDLVGGEPQVVGLRAWCCAGRRRVWRRR